MTWARYLPDLLLLWTAFALMVVSPGPSNMMIMATAMNAGRGPALALAAGVTAGSLTWGLLAAAGVSALIAANAHALAFVRTLGGAYLLYLGWRAAIASLRREGASSAGAAGESLPRLMLHGYLMHLTNPKAILGWMSIIAIGLPAGAPGWLVVVILLGCLSISLTSNMSYALVFSTGPMAAGYRRARRWIEAALAGSFIFAGLKLLTARL